MDMRNSLMKWTCQAMRLAHRRGGYVVLENPFSVYMCMQDEVLRLWAMPGMGMNDQNMFSAFGSAIHQEHGIAHRFATFLVAQC